MKHVVFIGLSLLAAPALAQTAPAITAPATGAAGATVGATVTGKDGMPAGTISAVTAEAVTIDTGTSKVPVPPSAIGTSAKGPTIQMTKAELDAAYAKAAAQAGANLNLAPGTMVHGLNNAMLGTIKSSDAQYVTVTTTKGDVKLPRTGFAAGTNNTVRVGITAADLDAALAGSASSSTSTTSTSPTTGATTTTEASTTTSAATGETTTTEAATTTTPAGTVKKAVRKKVRKPQ